MRKGEVIHIIKNPKDVLNKPRKKVNVIVSVYDGADFLEECLDSIQAQIFKPDKIILGIDGCKKSLKKIDEIRQKYDNLYVYATKKNGGVYRMFNALSELVPDNQYIQFFGADDRMFPDMLKEMQKNDRHAISKHVGVLFIKAEDFRKVGGYRDWRCAADADMILRLRRYFQYHEVIMPILFHRRVHDKQLTAIYPEKEGLRQEYFEITMRNYKSKTPDIYIKPVKTKLYEYSG